MESPSPQKEKRRISVRTLVESVLLSGSLSRDASAKRMLEGVRGHQALQSVAEAGVENEVAVSIAAESEHIALTVYGRIDRLHGLERVEEIKTTFLPVTDESRCPAQHWAQAMCYAHMLAVRHGLDAVEVQLTYFNLSTGEVTEFLRNCTREALSDAFQALLAACLAQLESELLHTRALKDDARRMGFPFASFREGQRTLAEQVYTALRTGRTLLAAAPTGTGKTMAVLFPAIKAMGEGVLARAFYLTARTTQQRAAVEAVERLGLPHLNAVVLAARDKMCVFDTPVCASGDCPRADGYYDRLGAALSEAAEAGGLFRPERVRQLAAKHLLCPFELALDLSLLCDLIICDYNYAFDPRVRLQRYFLRGGRQKQALLVDEAHNLPDRARDMYSAALTLKSIREARSSVPKEKRRGECYKALTLLKKAVEACFSEPGEPRAEKEPPAALEAPAARAAAALEAPDCPAEKGLARALAFELAGFLYTLDRYQEHHVTLYEGGKTMRVVTLFCFDPAQSLAETYKKCTGAVLFSATLSPFPFYRTLCGLPEDAPMLALPSPFPKENLLALRLSLSVRYRAREETLPRVAEAVAAFVSSRENGNFFVYLPSHAYLAKIREPLAALLPNASFAVQESAMDDAARESFLARFSPAPAGITVGLAVLGGVFAEGVDLPDERLSGAAIVGVGLPQVGLTRDVLRDAYEERYQSGFDYAYRFPGVGRVLQAAGRIIRTETDRGALLLIDDRFGLDDYAALLPAHWDVVRARSIADVQSRCRAFWAGR